jgi:dTDP-4-dehydrorhamnose reductase
MNILSEKQMRIVIVGATGMVGGYALRYMLDHKSVERVTAIGRRELGISHAKLKEVLHGDFENFSALAEALSEQNAAIFCLGAYTGAVSDEEQREAPSDAQPERNAAPVRRRKRTADAVRQNSDRDEHAVCAEERAWS